LRTTVGKALRITIRITVVVVVRWRIALRKLRKQLLLCELRCELNILVKFK